MKIVFITLIFLISIGVVPLSFATTESCQCVAFRLDDIQDYWLNSVQTKIIDTFQEKNASLTIGIIGNYFGNDAYLVTHIKEKMKNNNPQIQIANHGWNHEDFTKFGRDMQSTLMKNTNDKISQILEITPSVFIPPFNTVNSDTMAAFLENNFQYISANTTQDPPPYVIKNAAVYHLPGTAKTGNLNDGNTYWFSENHKQTFAEIMNSLQKYGYAMVVMHPQEYSVRQGLNYSNTVDKNQIHELESLIEEVRNDGINIVTINEIPKHTSNQEIPNWVGHIFTWYDKGEISEDEVVDAIKFLMANKIINFGSHIYPMTYPLHQNITATVFWVGESASIDNQFIDNFSSIWDDKWLEHYGGVDDPNLRNRYVPAKFTPHENSFYFALPYNDIENGTRINDANKIVYWSDEKNWNDTESMVKNKWIKITKNTKTVYAQWEDAGPFVYGDKNYVFGTALPINKMNNNAGLDVSPAVSDYLGLYDDNKNIVRWQFVDFQNVPDGPWKQVITSSQVSHTK
jgi:peptidoglycan/xylan/chitin deacetylase (PgdA/CDA1 family)